MSSRDSLTSFMYFTNTAFYSLNLSAVDAVKVATELAELTKSFHFKMLELALVGLVTSLSLNLETLSSLVNTYLAHTSWQRVGGDLLGHLGCWFGNMYLVLK